MPGATVTIVSPQGSRTLTTDSDGRFFAPFLTPGDYEVKVDLAGFGRSTARTSRCASGQRVDLPLSMQVGRVTEAVRSRARRP